MQCGREEGKVGTNYRGPAFRKGVRDPIILHVFLSSSVVP